MPSLFCRVKNALPHLRRAVSASLSIMMRPVFIVRFFREHGQRRGGVLRDGDGQMRRRPWHPVRIRCAPGTHLVWGGNPDLGPIFRAFLKKCDFLGNFA